jgi:hypothetical protein
MWIVLLEVCLHRVASWGIYLAVFAAATGYFQSDMATTRLGGGYFLSKGQQAMNRRLAMLPAMCVYFYGTDFARSSLPHYLILTVAIFTALVMILLPEPSE